MKRLAVRTAQGFNVAPQQAHAKAWKVLICGLANVASADELLDARGHLRRGLVGEGDGQNAVRRDVRAPTR